MKETSNTISIKQVIFTFLGFISLGLLTTLFVMFLTKGIGVISLINPMVLWLFPLGFIHWFYDIWNSPGDGSQIFIAATGGWIAYFVIFAIGAIFRKKKIYYIWMFCLGIILITNVTGCQAEVNELITR